MALPQELYNRCRATLLKCGQFDSQASLQAVFVTAELVLYRDGLPMSSSKNERVSKAIDYLLPKRLSDGRPVFLVFLAALRDRYNPGDELHDELKKRCSEVEQELDKVEVIDIPFVVVAMTNDEAVHLISEAVFDNPTVAPVERARFQQFREALQEHGITDLLPHYGEFREDWKPHVCQQSTIHEIVLGIAGLINQQRSETPGLSLIYPRPFSAGFFAEDEDTRLETWDQLGQLGCVIIVDSISAFHPMLRRILLSSEMGSNERAAMLVLSPVNSSAIPVNQLIEQEISLQMQRAFARFSKNLDRLCEIGIGDLRAFQRWLFAILPEAATIVQNQRPNPSNRSIIRERMGEPLGMEQLIFGQRGGR